MKYQVSYDTTFLARLTVNNTAWTAIADNKRQKRKFPYYQKR
jgi:hypothetical protein